MTKHYLMLFLLAIVLAVVASHEHPSPYTLIAHGGGTVGDSARTDSREALLGAIERGYKYIELDLQYTADSVLVAAYSWSEFNRITGCEAKGDTAPAYSEFAARRIHGRYTPISAHEVAALLQSDPSLHLVTDKVSHPATLLRSFGSVRRRVMPEAFSYADYCGLVEAGFETPLYSCMAADVYETMLKHRLLHLLFDGPKVDHVALHTSALSTLFYKILYRICNFEVALFTVNSAAEMPATYSGNIKYVYTDALLPTYAISAAAE